MPSVAATLIMTNQKTIWRDKEAVRQSSIVRALKVSSFGAGKGGS